jgi:hypothetical protein
MMTTRGISFILLGLLSVLTTRVQAQNADSLRSLLKSADSLDVVIALYLEAEELEKADASLTSLEAKLFVLRSSWSFLAQNMAYRKKVDGLGLHVRDYRKALFELGQKRASPDMVTATSSESAEGNLNVSRQVFDLMRDTMLLAEQLRRTQLQTVEMHLKNEELRKRLRKYEQGAFAGLSFGFNFFFNQAPQYYVKQDSTLGVYGNRRGMSFIISGVLGYKINEKHSILFNVPLQDFTADSQNAIGLFNKRMAGGLGYGMNLQQLTFMAIINISPYERLETDLLEGHKFQEQEVMSRLDLSNLPVSQAYSPSFTIGVSYNFLERFR